METRFVVMPANELKAYLVDALAEIDERRTQKQKEKDDLEKLYTINEVAKRLKRAHASIKKLVAAGIIRTTPDGMISEKSINDYLRNI